MAPALSAKDVRLRGAALVALAALLWSSGGLFIKLAPMSGLAVVCGRALVTALFYLAVLRPDLRQARASTALAYALMIITFVCATKLTTAANAIFLQYTGPAYVLLLSPLLLGEKLARRDAALVALSLAGMGLFFGGRVEAGRAWGNALGAVSGLFFGATVVLLRRDATRGAGDAMPSTTLGNLFAAALTLPFALGSLREGLAGPQALQSVGILLWLGLVQMGAAYILFARGLKSVPATEASLLSMLEPVFNPLWVLLGTGEAPGPWALAGGAVVLSVAAFRALSAPPEGPPAAG